MSDNELWTNFKAMVKDIKFNYPSKVEQYDLPSERIFGYKSTVEDKFWQIKIPDINMNFREDDDALGNELFKMLSVAPGKQGLLDALNEGKE